MKTKLFLSTFLSLFFSLGAVAQTHIITSTGGCGRDSRSDIDYCYLGSSEQGAKVWAIDLSSSSRVVVGCTYAFSSEGTVQFWSVDSNGNRKTKLAEIGGINSYDPEVIDVVSPESNGKMHIVFSSYAQNFLNNGSIFYIYVSERSGVPNLLRSEDAAIGLFYKNYAPPINGLLVEGKVGIGTRNWTAKLNVAETTESGIAGYKYIRLTQTSGNSDNITALYATDMLIRPTGGDVSYIKGVSTNTAPTPTTLNSWIKQTPGTISFGDLITTYMTIGKNVGIGTTSSSAKLNITETTALGTTANSYVRLTQTSGNSNTGYLYATDMLAREAAGSGLTTTSYMKGVSSSNAPTATTLNAWIKQYPSSGILSFGNLGTTYMTVGSNVGIGTTNPQYTLDVNGAIQAKELNIAKINADSLKIAIGGVDKFKMLAADNFAVGTNALNAWSSGSGNNIGLGYYSLGKTTTGANNIALGYYSLYGNTTGPYNIAHGAYSLYSNTSGSYNIALGYTSLYGNTTGIHNIGLGTQAGRYIANGSTTNATATNSLFLGRDTKAQAAGQTNQIVIGYDATGNGSNSVTLGSDAITKTILKGKVGIGTATPDKELTVEGAIHAREVFIDLETWADYVFAPDYQLMPLPEVEHFVKENKHLPNIPSAEKVKENGMNMGEIQRLLLQKIEELTLHAIQQQKIIEKQMADIEKQGAEIEALKKKIQ